MLNLFELENLSTGYQDRAIVSSVNLVVRPGEWITIVGPNGSGKSTLLKTLVGALKPIDGKLKANTKKYGYVPQALACPKNFLITTEEFLLTNPALKHLKGKAFLRELPVTKALGLEDFLAIPLCHLSGGQFKRAQLAFALLSDPDVLFLDEYLEGLDTAAKKEAQELVHAFHVQSGKTVIEVSHDLISVANFTKRVLFVNGTVLYDGPPSGQGFHTCLHHEYGEKAALREEHHHE